MPMGPMGAVARATDAKLGANGVVFQPGFDGTTPAPPNPEKSIYCFLYIFPIYFPDPTCVQSLFFFMLDSYPIVRYI